MAREAIMPLWRLLSDAPERGHGATVSLSLGRTHEERDMAGEWKLCQLNEVADVVGGGTPDTGNPAYYDGDIGWITPKDLSNYSSRYISKGERSITYEGLKNSSARLLPKGTVLFSSRAPIGYVAIAAAPLTTNQGFRNLVPKRGYDSEFLYYLLKANADRIAHYGTGSTFGEISGTVLGRLAFSFPSLAEQRAIAHILGTLDDKIELNRRMSETLEAMARAIFKAWFVDFEPVRAKMEGRWRRGESLPGLPAHLYDLFPSRLVASELGEIPEGWRVGKLGDVCERVVDKVMQREEWSDEILIDLGRMPKQSIALANWGRGEELATALIRFCSRDTLFGAVRPYFHKAGIAPVNGVTNVSVFVLRALDSKDWPYVGILCSMKETVDFATRVAKGTKMPVVAWEDFKGYKITLPCHKIRNAFSQVTGPFLDQIISVIHESRTLAALRDALLPKLIRGEMRVKDAERFLQERGL